MANPTHVFVTAPEGRLTPVAHADGVGPGGGQLLVSSKHVDRVRYTHTTIRSINRGDLVLCNMQGSVVATAALAAAPEDLGRIEIKPAKGGK